MGSKGHVSENNGLYCPYGGVWESFENHNITIVNCYFSKESLGYKCFYYR